MRDCIIIIYRNLGPYHLARLEALSQVTQSLVAVEIGVKQLIYPWRPPKEDLPYPLETLFDSPVEKVSFGDQKKAVIDCLRKYRPIAVIVSAYDNPAMRAAAKWARDNGAKDVLLFSTTELDRPRLWVKEKIKSYFIRGFYAVAASGVRAASYAKKLGVFESKVFIIGNVVDNEKCRSLADTFRKNRSRIQKELGLPDNYFLYVGRFSKEKNLNMLLRAFSQYRRLGGIWDLVLVGSGPEEAKLREMASAFKGHVRFVGWKQFDDLMAYYALARCFILPSLSEPWGLVVNEAMACGLPVLVSKNCGCVPELCKEGVNGHIFDPKDTDCLVSLMLSYSKGKFDLRRLGIESQRIIQRFTPKSWAYKLHRVISL